MKMLIALVACKHLDHSYRYAFPIHRRCKRCKHKEPLFNLRLLLPFLFVLLIGCAIERELQVHEVEATLKSVKTYQRGEKTVSFLRWQSELGTFYQKIEGECYYKIGQPRTILIR